jgi:hypothetical protein
LDDIPFKQTTFLDIIIIIRRSQYFLFLIFLYSLFALSLSLTKLFSSLSLSRLLARSFIVLARQQQLCLYTKIRRYDIHASFLFKEQHAQRADSEKGKNTKFFSFSHVHTSVCENLSTFSVASPSKLSLSAVHNFLLWTRQGGEG